MPKNTYETYEDVAGEFRWRYFGANGEQISKSSEGYTTRRACTNAIAIMKRSSNSPVKPEPKKKPKKKKR